MSSTAPAAGPQPDAGSSDPLREVDVSVLDKLIEIRKQQDQFAEYRKRASELKEKVEPSVFQRVLDDYSSRESALEREAAPLKRQALREYDKLRALYQRVNTTLDQARLEKNELEFRHAVGELTQEEVGSRLEKPNKVLEHCTQEIAAFDACKARFFDALTKEDLEAPVVEPPTEQAPAPEKAAALSKAAAPEKGAAPEKTVAPEKSAAAEKAAVPPKGMARVDGPLRPAEEGFDSTMSADGSGIIELPVEPDRATAVNEMPEAASPISNGGAVEPSPPPVGETSWVAPEPVKRQTPEEPTFSLPEASLVGDDTEQPELEFRLSAMNYIGRSEDNQIRLKRPGISRKHALIIASRTGFLIRDLQSQNGTFVNGDRVVERSLTDGDKITLGDARLVFKTVKGGRRG